MKHLHLIPLLCILLLTACQHNTEKRTYRIGVSQCSYDAWRINMDAEMERERIFHPDLVLHTRYAKDNSYMQCCQIDSFIAEKVDLLIVSPNETEEVKPAVSRAYDAGIPVIIADRQVSGEKYTAFIGGDNYEVGHITAQHLIQIAQKGGYTSEHPLRFVEIYGLRGSTPAVLRHRSLMEALAHHPEVKLKHKMSGYWFRAEARICMDSLLNYDQDFEAVVAQNDQMAIGAAEVIHKRLHNDNIIILGVDGITGHGGGVEAILHNQIDFTTTYPSRGDLIIQTADAILKGNSFKRDTVLKSVLVDPDVAKALHQFAELRDHEIVAIQKLQGTLTDINLDYDTLKGFIYVLVSAIILLLLLTFSIIYILRYRHQVRIRQMANEQLLNEQKRQLEQMTEQLLANKDTSPTRNEVLIEKLTHLIEENIDNPNLNMDFLAVELSISRAQLFRRVRSLTGESPVELIRHIRLHRAQEMLRNGDDSIQQVAYAVGFTSASYFTRCYKELFHHSPQEERS